MTYCPPIVSLVDVGVDVDVDVDADVDADVWLALLAVKEMSYYYAAAAATYRASSQLTVNVSSLTGW